MDFWEKELNAAQLEAVRYCDGPSLVIAGAGSGKTRVLTYKIAYLIRELHVSPYEILALTFTNKAAREMNTRIAQIVGQEDVMHLWSGTFHSIFARILRRECEHIQFTSNFTIYDTSDSKSLVKQIVRELLLDDKVYKASIIQSRISEAKNSLIQPAQYLADSSIQKRDQMDNLGSLGKIYNVYMQRLKLANAMDFDDLLLNTYILFREHPEVLARYKNRYRYILVDEYQDTNFAQHQIIRQLTDPDSPICVVGDDAQSIYGFRGAKIDNILQFTQQYPTARTIKLERNYRSTQSIVNAANSIISHNTRQIPKHVYSENDEGQPLQLLPCISDREEAAKVVGEIRRLMRYDHVEASDIAILYRVNALSRSFEDEFRKHEVPYRIYGGLSFYQRKEIKDVISYFRLLANPNDEEAFRRVVNYPARGIGKTTLDNLTGTARAHGVSLWQVATQPDQYGFNAGRSLARIREFCLLILQLQESMQRDGAYDTAVAVLQKSGMAADIHSGTDPEDLSRQENIDELLGSIRSFEQDALEQNGQTRVPLTEYLAQVSLLTDADNEDSEDPTPRITLMTIHAAKGLEYGHIFLVGMEEDIFPGSQALYPRQLEEERRLFYVAVTRAKTRCYISFAKSRFRYGSMEFSEPSRFLHDVDKSYLRIASAAPVGDGRVSSSRTTMQPTFRTVGSSSSAGYNAGAATPSRRMTPLSKVVQSPVSAHPSAARPAGPGAGGTSTYAIGARVQHDRFGQGTIKDVSGLGENLCVVVDFDSVGTKKLLLKFARLTIL